MKKNKKYLIYLRRLAQLASFLIISFIIWNTRFPLDLFINPKFYFYIDPLVMIATAVAERIFLAGLAATAVMIILTFILGRFFCGWLCPLGALMDLWVSIKIFIMKKLKKSIHEKKPGKSYRLKYIILSLLLISALAGIQAAWVLDPITIFVRTFSYIIHPFINNSIDALFVKLLMATDSYRPIEVLYNYLRESFLSLSIPTFPHTSNILAIFLIILSVTLIKRRFWCRYICPLGGLLAIPAKFSILKRETGSCTVNCRACMHTCRMNAIHADSTYNSGECILCLDCIPHCPQHRTTFRFSRPLLPVLKKPENENSGMAISRLQFLCYGTALTYTVLKPSLIGLDAPGAVHETTVLRAPGALAKKDFIQRCIRCGNCLKVCPTNVLKPSPLALGIDSLWTPYFDSSKSYCEYQCNLCGRVCPTGAIENLTLDKKKKFKIGIAKIDEKKCIPYVKGKNCLVCEEHCPVEDKAIKLKIKRNSRGDLIQYPVIDKDLCIGCAICEVKCPTVPEKSVKIFAEK